jgi:AraC-like DNA-binding protein
MAQFELLSPDGEDITFVDGTQAPKTYALAGAETFGAATSFGDFYFYHYAGEGFSIWKSVYDIRRPARVIGRADQSVIELTSMFEGSFDIDWTGVTAGKLPLKQIELYHAPWIDNVAEFRGGRQYLTLDVHLSAPFLEPYAGEFPVLDRFLGDVAKGRPAKLFGGAQLATPRLNAVLKAMMEYQFRDSLAPRYYDSYVHILLLLVLEQLSAPRGTPPLFSAADIEKAHEARRLLTAEYHENYTIARLSRKLATNPYKLKTAFRHLFGTSIGKYKKAAFMEYARQLLLDTDHSIDEIAMLIGYGAQSNFTSAFKDHFGCPPGWMRKMGKG